MPSLTITAHTLDHHGRVTKIATLAGDADSSYVAEIDTAISHLIAETDGALDLIIDGGSLTYINSTFIGHLSSWYTTLESRGGRLVLAALQPQAHDTLEVVGLLSLIPHAPSVDEAKDVLAEVA